MLHNALNLLFELMNLNFFVNQIKALLMNPRENAHVILCKKHNIATSILVFMLICLLFLLLHDYLFVLGPYGLYLKYFFFETCVSKHSLHPENVTRNSYVSKTKHPYINFISFSIDK